MCRSLHRLRTSPLRTHLERCRPNTAYGKSVIFADPKMPAGERLVRGFAAIADLTDYIPGPDKGTDELAMGWIMDETGRTVGLPCELGGIPLDEIGPTGDTYRALADDNGLDIGALAALKAAGMSLHDHPGGRKLDGYAVRHSLRHLDPGRPT